MGCGVSGGIWYDCVLSIRQPWNIGHSQAILMDTLTTLMRHLSECQIVLISKSSLHSIQNLLHVTFTIQIFFIFVWNTCNSMTIIYIKQMCTFIDLVILFVNQDFNKLKDELHPPHLINNRLSHFQFYELGIWGWVIAQSINSDNFFHYVVCSHAWSHSSILIKVTKGNITADMPSLEQYIHWPLN